METYIEILKNTQLFSGVKEKELPAMLNCLQPKVVSFAKGSYILQQGEPIHDIMILVNGKLLIQCDDFWGNRSIITEIRIGEMFGEAYIAQKNEPIPNDVVAQEESSVLFFDIQKILTICPSACTFHSIIIQNLFFAISEKNRKLVQKIGYMSNRTIRTKLLAYLSEEAKKQNNNLFSIPFNRQQLADFLCVDRSAMSNELSKMQEEGLLQFHKNKFKLL